MIEIIFILLIATWQVSEYLWLKASLERDIIIAREQLRLEFNLKEEHNEYSRYLKEVTNDNKDRRTSKSSTASTKGKEKKS